MIPLCRLQAFGDEIDIPVRRPDAGRRLLLERVQDIHGFLEPNRVHRSIGVSVVRLDDLQDARTEPLPRLRLSLAVSGVHRADGPPDDEPREQIQDCREVELAAAADDELRRVSKNNAVCGENQTRTLELAKLMEVTRE